jgi:hypothetical protein
MKDTIQITKKPTMNITPIAALNELVSYCSDFSPLMAEANSRALPICTKNTAARTRIIRIRKVMLFYLKVKV